MKFSGGGAEGRGSIGCDPTDPEEVWAVSFDVECVGGAAAKEASGDERF